MFYKLYKPCLLIITLLCSVTAIAETPETDEEATNPVEITADDAIAAGAASESFRAPNPCEGLQQGDFMGPEACAGCHQDKLETMHASPHGNIADQRSPFGDKGCETCHGPGTSHFDEKGNCITGMHRFGESVQQRNEVCLGCHSSGNRQHWSSSVHESENMACVSCHSIHKRNDVIHRESQTEVCFGCHKEIRSQTFRASSHPITENKVICSDCHNPHGSAGPSLLKQFSINENCYSCHAEKRGPFLWEHYPASEDCTLCHRVHGSNHQALLTKPGPMLCQQCHSNITGSGLNHIGRMLDFDNTVPSRNRFIVGRNCTNCHIKIHGSNHPSGRALHR